MRLYQATLLGDFAARGDVIFGTLQADYVLPKNLI
jgi:hypothetical protein